MANTQQNKRGGPGAMTMAMQAHRSEKESGPKVLRIGVIQGGKIVEERIIRTRKTVTVGKSGDTDFIVSSPLIGDSFPIFELLGEDYVLNFTDKMSGRVSVGAGVKKLNDLKRSGAKRTDSGFQVKLGPNSRGKVEIDGTVVIFQFVPPPPIASRPQLPAAARGSFVRGIDWLFTAFVVFSYMTFFGFVVYLENADWEIEEDSNEIPDLVARYAFREPEAPPEPPEPQPVDDTAEPSDEGEETEVAEAPSSMQQSSSSSMSSSPSSNSGSDAPSNAEARAQLTQRAAASAEQLIAGTLGNSGAFQDLMAGGQTTGSARDLLESAVGASSTATGSGSGIRERSGGGTGSGQAGGLGSIASGMGGGMSIATMMVQERQIRGNINVGGGGDIGGSGVFDSSIVVRQIRQRIGAIRRCYEQQLARDPSLAGRVTVQFTIQERGNVTGARASENSTGSPALATCVTSTVSRFRFNPGPDGGSVSFSYPFVFAPQN